MATHKPTLQVFRHASDDRAHDCGRACAQSIISSLTQGVPVGQTPTAAEKARPVPVTQGQLHALESTTTDTSGTWFTHPDELADLLKHSPDLAAVGHTQWRVAAEATRVELLEQVGACLAAGFPAILNIRSSDHWVLVRSVDTINGVVSFVRLLDPLNRRNAPNRNSHTYVDGCATDGLVIWETIDLKVTSLGTWSLQVGSSPRANYAGKYVAIVHGPAPGPAPQPLALRQHQQRQQRRPGGATPAERIFEELMRVSSSYDVPEITELLQERRDQTIRFVHDIDAKERGYTMSAIFSEARGFGLIGIYDFSDQAFMHAMLTTDRELIDGLTGDPAEPLWWTRRPLETLFSPYFPFRRVPNQLEPTYRRLADELELKSPPPRGT